MTQRQSHEFQVLLTNGTVVQLTLHELSGFLRSRHMIGFALFLTLILSADPVLFPALPEFQSRALYWTASALVYIVLLPYWVRFFVFWWEGKFKKPVPLILSTVLFVAPQAFCGHLIWSALGLQYAREGSFGLLATVVQNTLLAHLAEMAGLLWLLPAYRQSQREKNGGPPAAPVENPDRRFVVLGGRSVPLSGIRIVRSAEHYLVLTNDHRTIELRARMKDFLEQVSDADGVQTHRSIWVAASVAQELEGATVITTRGEKLPVSRGRMPDVRQWFEQQGKPH